MRNAGTAESGAGTIANALPMPVMLLGPKQEVLYANPAAEQFFDTGLTLLRKQSLADLIAPHSPLFQLVTQAAERLRVSRKTLQTKMKDLGLRELQENDGKAGESGHIPSSDPNA